MRCAFTNTAPGTCSYPSSLISGIVDMTSRSMYFFVLGVSASMTAVNFCPVSVSVASLSSSRFTVLREELIGDADVRIDVNKTGFASTVVRHLSRVVISCRYSSTRRCRCIGYFSGIEALHLLSPPPPDVSASVVSQKKQRPPVNNEAIHSAGDNRHQAISIRP